MCPALALTAPPPAVAELLTAAALALGGRRGNHSHVLLHCSGGSSELHLPASTIPPFDTNHVTCFPIIGEKDKLFQNTGKER